MSTQDPGANNFFYLTALEDAMSRVLNDATDSEVYELTKPVVNSLLKFAVPAQAGSSAFVVKVDYNQAGVDDLYFTLRFDGDTNTQEVYFQGKGTDKKRGVILSKDGQPTFLKYNEVKKDLLKNKRASLTVYKIVNVSNKVKINYKLLTEPDKLELVGSMVDAINLFLPQDEYTQGLVQQFTEQRIDGPNSGENSGSSQSGIGDGGEGDGSASGSRGPSASGGQATNVVDTTIVNSSPPGGQAPTPVGDVDAASNVNSSSPGGQAPTPVGDVDAASNVNSSSPANLSESNRASQAQNPATVPGMAQSAGEGTTSSRSSQDSSGSTNIINTITPLAPFSLNGFTTFQVGYISNDDNGYEYVEARDFGAFDANLNLNDAEIRGITSVRIFISGHSYRLDPESVVLFEDVHRMLKSEDFFAQEDVKVESTSMRVTYIQSGIGQTALNMIGRRNFVEVIADFLLYDAGTSLSFVKMNVKIRKKNESEKPLNISDTSALDVKSIEIIRSIPLNDQLKLKITQNDEVSTYNRKRVQNADYDFYLYLPIVRRLSNGQYPLISVVRKATVIDVKIGDQKLTIGFASVASLRTQMPESDKFSFPGAAVVGYTVSRMQSNARARNRGSGAVRDALGTPTEGLYLNGRSDTTLASVRGEILELQQVDYNTVMNTFKTYYDELKNARKRDNANVQNTFDTLTKRVDRLAAFGEYNMSNR